MPSFRQDRVGFRPDNNDDAPTLDKEDARQADGDRESLRILDRSLPIAVLAMAIVGLYFAISAAA